MFHLWLPEPTLVANTEVECVDKLPTDDNISEIIDLDQERVRRKLRPNCNLCITEYVSSDSSTVEEAMASQEPLLLGKKAILSKWVLKRKVNADDDPPSGFDVVMVPVLSASCENRYMAYSNLSAFDSDNDTMLLDKLKNKLSETLKMKALGAASSILGMRISQNVQEGTLRIDQSSYKGDVIPRFGMDTTPRERKAVRGDDSN
ncbi:unnamed protein product [Ceratitis capitata]|uniref:(Mediterranean fruit fly) hypothetical protein n=1 Tax=Ceratitis capitata TaxID=7213 RepID=A0A811UJF9_CERCA|nr:unnamed protein product [Ceratitis capitata]